MTRKILPSKRVALLVDAGPAVPLENRLATSVVSVNAKEGKTQKENHRLEIFQELVVVEIVFVKPGSTTMTDCHSRRLLHLHFVQVARRHMYPRRWNKETKPPPGRNKRKRQVRKVLGVLVTARSLPLVLAVLRPLKLRKTR